MSGDLPPWVLELVYRLDRAEDEHPKFYRYVGPTGSDNAYEPTNCYLSDLLKLVPADVLSGVQFAARWQPAPDGAVS